MATRRTAMVERMRRAEPATDAAEAAEAARVARNALSQSRGLLLSVLLCLSVTVSALFAEPVAVRLLGVISLLTCIAGAVWAVLNRQGARRALDANRRRWGPL